MVTGANQAMTISRQATNDTTNLPNIQYCARIQRNSGQTGTGFVYFAQSFESINSIPLAGKTVTFSFYARAGANFSGASSQIGYNVYTGTGTDQQLISYTGQANPLATAATLTTTWQRFSGSATLATTATELSLQFGYLPVGTASTNDYFEVTGVQLEASTVASAFSTNGGTYQAELAACQRYYYRATPGAVNKNLGISQASSATVAGTMGFFPVEMRTAPTALEQSGTANQYALVFAGTATTCSAVPTHSASTTTSVWQANFTVTAGLVAGQGGRGISDQTNGANAYLGWSAEL
jgi:hypothetical protein